MTAPPPKKKKLFGVIDKDEHLKKVFSQSMNFPCSLRI